MWKNLKIYFQSYTICITTVTVGRDILLIFYRLNFYFYSYSLSFFVSKFQYLCVYMLIFGLVLALFIGITLGLVGSGGSILTVPVFVYALGVDPNIATTYSLLAIALSSSIGSI